MSAVESAFAVSQRVGGCFHRSQILVSTFVQIADHFQIIVQHFVKITALGSCFGKDHREMQADSTDVEASGKYWHIFVVCRIHTASFVPRT